MGWWRNFIYENFQADYDDPLYHANHPDPYVSMTARDVLDFQDALASNPNAAAPPFMPPDIESEEREIARQTRAGV